jgi:FKBP-type peptidyl-prolyl cis-trans isomerase
MRRLFILLLLVVIAAACNKEPAVTITAEERLVSDVSIIDTYLAEKNIDAVKLESGVRYKITQAGSGPTATKDNCVRYKYAVYVLYETEAFNASTTDTGVKTPLKSLVTGMQIAMKQLPAGSKAEIYLPSGLAYGPNPGPNSPVPGNSILRFEMEIVELTAYNLLGDYCN